MNVDETRKIDELHEFLKSKLMHQSDPRRRLIDDAFGTIQNISIVEQIKYWDRYATATRSWPYFAAIAIYSKVWRIEMSLALNDYRFVNCLQAYFQDFPRLAYLNVSLDDPKFHSCQWLIGKLLRVPEYRDFWANFGPVEQEVRPALDKEEESHLKDELRERIKQELKQELREDIRNELKAELKVSIEEELKAELKGDVEASQVEETGPTGTHEMEQSTSGVFSEEDSNSSSEDSANGLSMDDAGNESKGVATETVEELVGNLINTLEPKIDVKIRKSEKDELKDAFQGVVEVSQDEEPGPTVTHEMNQSTSGKFSEEHSNSSSEDSANGQSMDDAGNESKGVAPETVEELPEDLVSVGEPKINVKITKNEKDEHKVELAEESTNDPINQATKHEMHLEIQKEGKEKESKAEIREPVETKVDEVKLTVPREMEQRDESREEVSNSLKKESAYGFSMDDVRNETKRIVTEANEELKGDLVNVLELKIKAKIAKSVKNELKDELAEEVANDLMDFKRDMKKKQTKMMDTLREQLHEDIRDEIVQMIQQDLKKCLQDLRRNKPN